MIITYDFHIIEGETKMKIQVDDSKPGKICYLYVKSGNIKKYRHIGSLVQCPMPTGKSISPMTPRTLRVFASL